MVNIIVMGIVCLVFFISVVVTLPTALTKTQKRMHKSVNQPKKIGGFLWEITAWLALVGVLILAGFVLAGKLF
jgi:hypothetical protein